LSAFGGLGKKTIYGWTRASSMLTQTDIKATKKVLTELNESYIDLLRETKATTQSVRAAKNLWRAGYKSRLIKIGVTLVMFPEPTPISETVGACFIAAGAVQKAVRSRAIFMEDVKKSFRATMKDLAEIKQKI
jgi:hypothetical protein